MKITPVIVVVGILLMLATRSHHFFSSFDLPDASLAVFFLVGMYVRSVFPLPMLLLSAAMIDAASVYWFDVSGFCVTPAYVMLIPAYASVWLAGRWCAQTGAPRALAWSVGCVGGSLCAELIASGSFYFFGGRFPDPTMAGFILRLAGYYPATLMAMSAWVMVGVVLRRLIPVLFYRYHAVVREM